MPDRPRPDRALVARRLWKDEDHGWRVWERHYFAYNNYLRIWVSWEEGVASGAGATPDLHEADRRILRARLGESWLREVFSRAGLDPPDLDGPRDAEMPQGPIRVWHIVYGREPDLFPWYRNPIHRLSADAEAVTFEIREIVPLSAQRPAIPPGRPPSGGG